MLLVLLVNALFSLVFPLGKAALIDCPPFFLVGIRCLIAGLCVSGYALYSSSGRKSDRLSKPGESTGWQLLWSTLRRDWWYIFILALFNIYLTNSFEFWGLQYMSSAKASFIYNFGPFFAAFFSYLYFGERMSNRKWLGLVIGFIGFLPILIEESRGEGLLRHLFFISTAELSLMVAVIASMYGWVVVQDLIRKKYTHIVLINGLSMIGGGIFSFINSLCVETWMPTPVQQWWPFLGWLTGIIIVSHFICYPLYTYLLRIHTATFMAFTSIISPSFAALFDYFFFGTVVAPTFYIANIVVAIGLYIFYQEEISLGEFLE